MKLNPLNTLTGRLVLVTVLAVIISYAIAFALYANERGAALRRAAETSVAERVVFTQERLLGAGSTFKETSGDWGGPALDCGCMGTSFANRKC